MSDQLVLDLGPEHAATVPVLTKKQGRASGV